MGELFGCWNEGEFSACLRIPVPPMQSYLLLSHLSVGLPAKKLSLALSLSLKNRIFAVRTNKRQRMKYLGKISVGAALALVCLAAGNLPMQAQKVDVMADTWVCNDGLNRVVASSDKGVSRSKVDTTVQVGMFYYIWHGQHGSEVKDITRLLEADPDNPAWGNENQFHWGGKPALGYYTAGDRFIIAKHMQMLMDAGVDFYFFDVTNAFTYDDQVKAVMNEIDRREKLGLKTPRLAFCTHSGGVDVIASLYNRWYSNSRNDKYWFYWNGKPLILVNKEISADIPQNLRNYFTLRYSWAWEEGEDQWPWLAYAPQQYNYSNETGTKVYEQMTVAAAMHPCSNIGKSYSKGRQPTVDKYGVNATTTPQGLFLQEQFNNAITRHPKVLMITQWNEWMAQRFIVTAGTLSLTRPGATPKVGETYFVDVYNQEYSRDIEPSSEPLIRDNYYLLTVSNLRRYRGVHKIPVPTACHTIDLEGGFAQWADVDPEFFDEPGDVVYSSTTAIAASCRKRRSNDIVGAKVAKDADNLYFYVRVDGTSIRNRYASKPQETWMNVLINSDLDYSNGWEGYDYMIAGDQNAVHLYRYDADSLAWLEGPEVAMAKEGAEMMYAVPRAEVGLTADVDFDFKWVDNTPAWTTEILDFLSNGDCAPNGRFNYRYKGSLLSSTAIDAPSAAAPALPVYDLQGRVAPIRGNGIYVVDGKKVYFK